MALTFQRKQQPCCTLLSRHFVSQESTCFSSYNFWPICPWALHRVSCSFSRVFATLKFGSFESQASGFTCYAGIASCGVLRAQTFVCSSPMWWLYLRTPLRRPCCPVLSTSTWNRTLESCDWSAEDSDQRMADAFNARRLSQ